MEIKEVPKGTILEKPARFIYSNFASHLPVKFRYSKVFWKTYNFLQESQWWSRERLEEYQMQQLSKLLNHAYENVPYYRRVFDERGLKPKDIQDFDDLRKLPYLTKEMIKAHKEDFLSKIHNKSQLVPAHTGGSTGSPLHFWNEKGVTSEKERAFFHRYWGWHKYNYLKDKSLTIIGSFDGEEKIRYSPANNSLCLYNPVFSLTKVQSYIKSIEEFKPKVIRGYPSLIFLFTHFVNHNNIKINWPFLQTVFCASEKVFDFQREEIQEAFNCKVVDHYGHNEMLTLMQKCEENNYYHIILEYGITEIIGDDGLPVTEEGKIGEIVGTGFNNYAFPMIRYKTEDWTITSNKICACGRAYPLVKEVIGRSGDFILAPSGKLVSPTVIEFAIRYIKNFKDVQIVQVDTDMLEIQIVADASYNREEGKRFTEGIQTRIGENMHIDIKLVNEIERPLNQKRRFIKSDISNEFIQKTKSKEEVR